MLSAVATIGDRSTERSGRRHFTSLNYCHRFTHSDEPNPTALHSLELCIAPLCIHTAHKHMCVLAADPSWCLIPSHFRRPLLLSNWGGSEYNYGENHPALMWGRINGIKKIICWPSGPGAVWGWEGNLKQRRRRDRGALMSGMTKASDHREARLACRWGITFCKTPPSTISPNPSFPPHCPHTHSCCQDVQEQPHVCIKDCCFIKTATCVLH